MQVVRVAADDEHGLRLWLPIGSPYWRLVAEDGRGHHDAAIDQLRGARLARYSWTGSDVMIWMPENQPYSVFWFWADGMFSGWHVNLEEPYVRWADRGCAGVDTADQALGRDRPTGPLVAVAGRGRVPRPDRPSALLDRGPGRPDPRHR